LQDGQTLHSRTMCCDLFPYAESLQHWHLPALPTVILALSSSSPPIRQAQGRLRRGSPCICKIHTVNKIFRHISPQKSVLYIDGAFPVRDTGAFPL
jgi:hypothetical protein